MMSRRVLRTIAIGLALMLVAACPGPSATRRPSRQPAPPTATAASNLQLALDAAWQRFEILGDGEWRPKPFILDWSQVASGTDLTAQQNDAFCTALDKPGVDDALATLVSLAVDALSLRLRHAPLSDEANVIIGLAAKFALKTCPGWLPVVNPSRPVPTPVPVWHPAGYSIVLGDPNLVWRWSTPGTFQCAAGFASCYQIDVLARFGCARVDAVLHVKDETGAVVEVIEQAIVGVPDQQPSPLGFGSALPPTTSGELIYLTCS